MKNLLYILILCSGFYGFAQESRLTIFSENGDPFYVILNGIRQNENPVTNIAIDYLTNPYYSAKIIFTDESIPPIEKKHLMVTDVDDQWGEVTYKIKDTRRGKRIRFFSFVPFQQIVAPPPSVVLVHYNANPLPPIGTITQTTTTTTTGPGETVNVGVNVGGVNMGVGVNLNSNTTTTTTTTTTQTVGSVRQDQVIIAEETCFKMSTRDFKQAIASIQSKSFEDSKLSVARQVAKNYCLTAAQIGGIMQQLTFEESKLDFAKFAYTLSFDPENYWKVNNSFDFESSIEELDRYISTLGR